MVVHHNNDRSKIGQSLLLNVYLSKKDSICNNWATDHAIQATLLYLKVVFLILQYSKQKMSAEIKERQEIMP